MKKLTFKLTILLILFIASACGKKAPANQQELSHQAFNGVSEELTPYIDNAITTARKVLDGEHPNADESFWNKYLQLQDEAGWVIHYMKEDLEKDSKEISNEDLEKAKTAIIDYYLDEVDKAYAEFDNHYIPVETRAVEVEYLSNNRFKDVNVRIKYHCTEPEYVLFKNENHIFGLKPIGSTHLRHFIGNTSHERSMVVIVKPMAEIPSATYTFETSLPGRDYIENVKDEDKKEYEWCDFTSIGLVNSLDCGSTSKYGNSWHGQPSGYNPTYVLISKDGSTIEVDDEINASGTDK